MSVYDPISPAAEVHRMHAVSAATNPVEGRMVWSPVKSLWFSGHFLVALVGGYLTASVDAVVLCAALTGFTVCLGGVGLHRLLIHRSFQCPRWVEYVLVHIGTVTGMGGPFSMLYMHDIRDWAQRHPACHPLLSQQGPLWRDWLWQTHGALRLSHPPRFEIESKVRDDVFYRFLQQTWMLQQLPLAVVLYAIGGLPWLTWVSRSEFWYRKRVTG